jgi:hypothetical protein
MKRIEVKRIFILAVFILFAGLMVTAVPTGEILACGDDCGCSHEGCTPGYWKQDHHFDSWEVYEPDDVFDEVFEVNAFPGMTLLDVLWQGGGKEKALGRHAVAALLNASNGDVDYDYSVGRVINIVQEAFDEGRFKRAKNKLEDANEEGCPLN